jgi:GMP synthase (glutamine-hydrolysing)
MTPSPLIAVFRHVPFESLGSLEDVLIRAGLKYQYFDLFTGQEPPRMEATSALISLGGPMSANDPLPFLAAELRLLESALRARKPLLGICLGAQLLARALGARVYPNPVKEIGWFPVEFTAEAQADPLFHGPSKTETVFQWHGETFDLPQDSVWLASSDNCPHQAFRFGPNVWGLQFHLETTPAMIAEWSAEPVNCADVASLAAPPDPCLHAARQLELASLVFGRWAALVRSSTTMSAGPQNRERSDRDVVFGRAEDSMMPATDPSQPLRSRFRL